MHDFILAARFCRLALAEPWLAVRPPRPHGADAEVDAIAEAAQARRQDIGHVIHAVADSDIVVRKDLLVWRGLGANDIGPARVQWTVDKHLGRMKLLSIVETLPEPASAPTPEIEEAAVAGDEPEHPSTEESPEVAVRKLVLDIADKAVSGEMVEFDDGTPALILSPREKPPTKQAVAAEASQNSAPVHTDASEQVSASSPPAQQGDSLPLPPYLGSEAHVRNSYETFPGGGENQRGPRLPKSAVTVNRKRGLWAKKMVVRLVMVFDKPGGVGSERLTGRLMIRSGISDGQDAGEGDEGVGGEWEEVVVNGVFVRDLLSQDVEVFDNAMLQGGAGVFEGVVNYDQLFPSNAPLFNAGSFWGAEGGGGIEVIETEREREKKRFLVKFEGRLVSTHASRQEAEQVQLDAELERLSLAEPADARLPEAGASDSAHDESKASLPSNADEDEQREGGAEEEGGRLPVRKRSWRERLAAVEAVGKLSAAVGSVTAIRRLLKVVKEDPVAILRGGAAASLALLCPRQEEATENARTRPQLRPLGEEHKDKQVGGESGAGAEESGAAEVTGAEQIVREVCDGLRDRAEKDLKALEADASEEGGVSVEGALPGAIGAYLQALCAICDGRRGQGRWFPDRLLGGWEEAAKLVSVGIVAVKSLDPYVSQQGMDLLAAVSAAVLTPRVFVFLCGVCVFVFCFLCWCICGTGCVSDFLCVCLSHGGCTYTVAQHVL